MALKNTNMNLILTMAGKYSRFTQEGYKLPKYLLPWGNNPILCEIIHNLNKDKVFNNIFLIANINDDIYMPHVKKILLTLGYPPDNLITIPDTSGQVETAILGIKKIEEKYGKLTNHVIFHNIDTILYDRDFTTLHETLNKYDGYIDVFKSNNHDYSYVREENGLINSVTEKILISDKATSGLYGFSSVDKFLNFCNKNNLYMSEVYQNMIENNKKIISGELFNENNTIVLGTPLEYLKSAYKYL